MKLRVRFDLDYYDVRTNSRDNVPHYGPKIVVFLGRIPQNIFQDARTPLGQAYSIDPDIDFPFTPGIFGEAFGFNARPKGQVFQQSLDKRPAVVSTPEGPPQDDDSYMGYSMVIGDFNNEGVQGVAVGMPKGGEELEGRILLYTWNLTNYLNISGTQLGSYFGYALANSDVDGDKRDDLIIGAPLYTQKNTVGKYEVGRVEIACQGTNGSFSKRIILDGFNSKSRFGLSLSTLGDLNLDGYGDFAVGAPYDGPFERGAVYIFLGAPNGDVDKYSQVIYAEDVQKSYIGPYPVSTFGFSIAGGLDLDGNDYPDMAIGAYLSDVAYFYRARPVVKVEAYIKFLTPHKQLFLEQKDCTKPGFPSISVTCTDIEVCVRYTGLGAPSSIKLDIQHVLDAKKLKHPSRMYLKRGTDRIVNTTIVLYKDSQYNCELREKVYLEEQIIDKLTELVIEVRYLLNNTKFGTQTVRNPHSILVPILDKSKLSAVNDSVSIYKNCGLDNVCIPDLRLHVTQQFDGYVYEFGKALEFLIEVTNHAEDAYNAKFFFNLPKGTGFKVAKRIDYPESKVSCSSSNETLFVCDIGNPLSKVVRIIIHRLTHFTIQMEPLRYHFLSPSYDFVMNVTSANPELPSTLHDNEVRTSIKVLVNAILSTEGKSVPKNVYYNLDQYPTEAKVWDTEVGPSVIHWYTVTNRGPSDVQSVEIFIIWPHLSAEGKDLLYLLEEPHTLGDVQCERVGANYNGFTLAGQRDVWDIVDLKHQYHHHNATPHVQHPNGTLIQGQIGNTITTTETEITYYDEKKNIIHKEKLTGEPNFDEYWQQVTKYVNNYHGPLTVAVNTTIYVKYENGTVVSHPSNRPGTPEVPFTSYEVHSNSTTVVSYLDPLGNIIFEELISEEPGSESFTKRVRSTTDRYTFPVAIRANTTKETTYMTQDGKVLYQEFFSKIGSGDTTNIETSKVTTVINVVLYNENGDKLEEHTTTAEPGTKAYWEQIDKFVGNYTEPVTIRTFKSRQIIYYVNGVEIRKEELSGSSTAASIPFRSYVDTTTTITCFDFNGNVLEQKSIPTDSESEKCKDLINNMIKMYKQAISIKTNTTNVITYRTSDGKVTHIGFNYKEKTNQYNQNAPQTVTTVITTIITIYDSYGNIINKETITKEPGTPEYWDTLNKIISHYKVPITIGTSTTKTIKYYINGKEVGKEEISLPTGEDRPFIIHTETSTTVTCTDDNNKLLFQTTIPVDTESKIYKDILANIINQHHELIMIKTNSTKLITYRTENGEILHTGIVHSEKTEYHNQNQTSLTTTTTTITIYDSYGRIINTETLTEEPGSPAYWDKINKIIAQYTIPVTITTTSVKTTTYYVNGKETGKEEVPISGGGATTLTNDVETTTTITCHSLQDGSTLYFATIPGDSNTTSYKEMINTLLSTHAQPITITTKVTKVIKYKDNGGNIVYTGTHFEERVETFNLHSGETSQTTTLTTLSIYGSNGELLTQENITEEPGSSAYWEKVNKFIAKYTIPITMQVTTNKIVTYYINGIEVRKEEKPVSGGSEMPSSTQIESTATIICRDRNGKILYETTISGDKQSTNYQNLMKTITQTYKQPISVSTSVRKIIKYINSKGNTVYTGTTYEDSTDTYNQNMNETTTTITETILTIYDENRNLLQEEVIKEEPGSSGYWEEINQIVNKYSTPITIRINIIKTIVFYINGIEIRRERMPDTVTPQEPFTTQVDVTTDVTCYANDGNTLYQTTIPGNTQTPKYNELINSLRNQYPIPITINSNTTKIIKYLSSDRRIVYTGYVHETKIQKYNQHTGETSRVSTITIVRVHSTDGRILDQLTIIDAPGSPAYWEQINKIVVKYSETLTIHSDTKKVITYYVNGKEIRSEQIPGAAGDLEDPFKVEMQRSTTINCYGQSGNLLNQQTIPADRTSTTYLNHIAAIKRQYPDHRAIHSNTTITIYYRNSQGIILHVANIVQQSTEQNRPEPTQTTQTITITTIIFYDSNGNVLHKEIIRDEPGSPAYWESIKNTISAYPLIALKIHTNTTKIITYYINGREINRETLPTSAGIYETPFSSHTDIVNIITFYGPNRQFVHQETVQGELSATDKQRYLQDFSRTHGGQTFTMETNTTKTVTYRTTDGRILFTDGGFVPRPIIKPQEIQTKTEVKTTFTVYGPDRVTILNKHTITGEPGSPAYNDYIAQIVARFPGSITIYTNSTKTITSFGSNGQPYKQVINEPRSTIQRARDSPKSKTTTSITFYSPDGKTLHHDTISGEPNNELLEKLNEIARTYDGVVKSSVEYRTANEGVEGLVTHVDTPYPGHKVESSRQHFTDFDTYAYGPNEYYTNYTSGNYNSGPLMNLRVTDHQNLGQYAKKQGYIDGGIDLGNVDRRFDSRARSHLETNQDYSNLRKDDGGHHQYHIRHKREDTTTQDIKRLSECKTSNCSIIRCTTGQLHNGKEVHIALRARINVQTLTLLSTTQTVNIQSMMLARISEYQDINGVPEKRTLYRQQAITTVMPPWPEIKPDIVPLWVVILSAVAGTLILLLLIFLLYKCGFFNRSRPSDAPERQPLNRNGHFQHGDEAL
ncbi:hypothetical protein FQA39_LY05852 [Lamprigera yunnana]|nr:hypothetical protein FQA39_LY05852 [Lamprigera yunnana]